MALKKSLHSTRGKWVDKLLRVLWAYRTTSRKPIRVSLFALTYGMEAIIPIEIRLPTLRTEVLGTAKAGAISKDQDMVDELWEAITIRIASYQERMVILYNNRIKPHAFQAGALVLRKVFENTANPADGKFQPNEEGPYVIVRVGPTGSYALNKLDRALVPRMFYTMHLKRYY